MSLEIDQSLQDEARNVLRADPELLSRANEISIEAAGGLLASRAEPDVENLGASVLWRNFKKELRVLLCTDDREYAEVRKKIKDASKVTNTVIIPTIAAEVGHKIGVAAGVLTPFVALALLSIARIAKQMWCKASSENETPTLNLPPGSDPLALQLGPPPELSSQPQEAMITEKQIEKLVGHALLFSENLRSLIQTFEMLQPVAEDQALLLEHSGTKRAHGLLVVRWSMIQECLIGITKLAFDQQPNNPSACNLITGLLAPEAKELREALKTDFAVQIKPGPPLDLGERTPEQLQDWEEHLKEEEKREAKELEAAFEEHLKSLSERWFWFENHRTEFKKIRDKQLAHLDTSKIGSDYVLTPVNGPDWKTVKEAIDRLVELAKLLLTVLHRLDESFDQFRDLAKQDASGFWQVPRSPDRKRAQRERTLRSPQA
jgi:hypothetical protein